jgi:hypothetical protein
VQRFFTDETEEFQGARELAGEDLKAEGKV